MNAEYQPEHILGAMFEMRDNQRIEDRVSKYIEKKGWSHVIELLQKGRELEAIVPGWDIPLRKGVLRDGMIELLQLQNFMGLDVDFVDAFSDLEVKNLDDLRRKSRERAMVLLDEQVKRGLTFFMDLDRMADTEFAIFVPDVLESRARQIERLRDSPHLYEIYSTYYGFTILTSGVKHGEAGLPEDIRDNLLSIFSEMGGVKEIKSKQLKFSTLAFSGCSGHLLVLLWNMLRLSLGGQKYKTKALDKLAELGDSRALSFLHSIYDSLPPSMNCICAIGHPSSYEFFEEHEWVDTRKPGTFEPMSQVRHPAMIEPIQHRIGLVTPTTSQWQVVPTIIAAGNTRLRQWIPFYEKMKGYRSTKIKKATERALKNVHPPFEEEEPV